MPQATRYSMALVVAMQRLLAAALREPCNQRFVVLSESCAPCSPEPCTSSSRRPPWPPGKTGRNLITAPGGFAVRPQLWQKRSVKQQC